MATVVEEPRTVRFMDESYEAEQRFVIPAVSWDQYEGMLTILGDRPIRVTYDGRSLELMSPSVPHEECGQLFGLLIQAMAEELDFPCRGLKSATWRRQLRERGLEADECFYLASLERVLGKKTIDLDRDPPPDLAIEIELSTSALNRMEIYARLGIPEVWRFDGETLRVVQLQPDGNYATSERSPSLPFVPLDEIVRFVKLGLGADHARWGRQLRCWIREVLVPLYHPPERIAD